jgi:GntR family transcriptional regulator/MocR family aminotransferase
LDDIMAPSKTPTPLSITIIRSSVPVPRQLAEQLKSAILAGEIKHGSRLPPSRELAGQCGISRNAVVEAYAELAAGGLLQTRGKGGSFVLYPRVASSSGVPGKTHRESPKVVSRLEPPVQPVPHEFDLRPGQVAAQRLPEDIWRSACREAGHKLPPTGYGDPRGDLSLRRAVVAWLRRERSIDVTTEHIVITSGSSHAINIIARALLREGDICAVEDPGYPLAIQAFRRAGAAISGVSVDLEEGLAVDQVFQSQIKPHLIHVTPNHQYPLGGRMSGIRRSQLIEGARRHQVLILENEYDHEFIHAGLNLPPLFAIAPEQVAMVSTFGKSISPSLRLGFIAAERRICDGIAELIDRDRQHVSWPVQQIVNWLLRSGELERHLRRVRRHYARLRGLILERLDPLLPRVSVRGHEGGLHVALLFPSKEVCDSAHSRLTEAGVLMDQLSTYSISQSSIHGLLMGYGHLNEKSLVEALNRVLKILALAI